MFIAHCDKLDPDTRDSLVAPFLLRRRTCCAALPSLHRLGVYWRIEAHIQSLDLDPFLTIVTDLHGGVRPPQAKGQIAIPKVGAVLDHAENGPVTFVICPETKILQTTKLLLEGKSIGDNIVMGAQSAARAQGVEEAFTHESILELVCT